MRLLVLGVNAQGISCVTEQQDELAFNAIPGLQGSVIAKLFATSESPPGPSPSGEGKKVRDGLAPGHVSWYMISHEPYGPGKRDTVATELHYRNVVDLIFILEGGGEMILGDGAHPVRAGDCIVMPGTSHGLRPGPQGCKLMAFAIGSAQA
jgi:mannose-6-phosphate isomerase-like protein (cupin superfamily)